jgi:glyceraldehyde 3-phosphate dehydrogenase
MMTTIHSYTGDQPTLDTMHKDLYRGRAAALSMIPTSTGAAKAIGLVLPELNGKLDGIAIRVPTPNVSVVDFKFIAKRDDRARTRSTPPSRPPPRQAQGHPRLYTDHPNVSIDFNHDPHSSIFHMDQTKVMDGTLVSVLSWYDNEWGFSNRMSDTAVAPWRARPSPRSSCGSPRPLRRSFDLRPASRRHMSAPASPAARCAPPPPAPRCRSCSRCPPRISSTT